MTIEATLSEVLSTLKAIHTALASGAAVGATAPATATTEPAAPAAETKPRKPREVATSPAATETKPAATQPAATKAADWKADVMPVLLEINKSTKPGHGRDGLVSLITKFLGDATKKIPDLEKLGKHDEVLAAAKALLTGEPVAAAEPDDEFGLGI